MCRSPIVKAFEEYICASYNTSANAVNLKGVILELITSKKFNCKTYNNVSIDFKRKYGLTDLDTGIDCINEEEKKIYQVKFLKPNTILKCSTLSTFINKCIDLLDEGFECNLVINSGVVINGISKKINVITIDDSDIKEIIFSEYSEEIKHIIELKNIPQQLKDKIFANITFEEDIDSLKQFQDELDKNINFILGDDKYHFTPNLFDTMINDIINYYDDFLPENITDKMIFNIERAVFKCMYHNIHPQIIFKDIKFKSRSVVDVHFNINNKVSMFSHIDKPVDQYYDEVMKDTYIYDNNIKINLYPTFTQLNISQFDSLTTASISGYTESLMIKYLGIVFIFDFNKSKITLEMLNDNKDLLFIDTTCSIDIEADNLLHIAGYINQKQVCIYTKKQVDRFRELQQKTREKITKKQEELLFATNGYNYCYELSLNEDKWYNMFMECDEDKSYHNIYSYRAGEGKMKEAIVGYYYDDIFIDAITGYNWCFNTNNKDQLIYNININVLSIADSFSRKDIQYNCGIAIKDYLKNEDFGNYIIYIHVKNVKFLKKSEWENLFKK